MKSNDLLKILIEENDKYWDGLEACDEPEFSLYLDLVRTINGVIVVLKTLKRLS